MNEIVNQITISVLAFSLGWYFRGRIAQSCERKLLQLLRESHDHLKTLQGNFESLLADATGLLDIARKASIAKRLSTERQNPFSEHGPN